LFLRDGNESYSSPPGRIGFVFRRIRQIPGILHFREKTRDTFGPRPECLAEWSGTDSGSLEAIEETASRAGVHAKPVTRLPKWTIQANFSKKGELPGTPDSSVNGESTLCVNRTPRRGAPHRPGSRFTPWGDGGPSLSRH